MSPRPPDGEKGPGREEVRFHLEEQARELMDAGWSPEEARKEARRRFGDPDRVTRTLDRMERRRRRRAAIRDGFGSLGRDVGTALRQLRRHPLFAVSSITVMAVGVGLAAAVFAVVDAVLLRPLPFPGAEGLVAVTDLQDGDPTVASLPEFRDWARDADFLASSAAFARFPSTLAGDRPEEVAVGRTAGDWLAVTGLAPVTGRAFTGSEREGDAPVAMLAEDRWRAAGADPDVVGRSIVLDGESVVIVGVMPREAGLPVGSTDLDFWRPLREEPWMSRGLHFLRVVARLEQGVDPEGARQRAEVLAAGLVAEGATDHGIGVVPLRERLVGESGTLVRILAGAVVLVLLAVGATLANLWLVRALRRRSEFAVRTSLGAGQGRIARQVATEAAVAGGLAGILALAIAQGVVGVVARAAGTGALAGTVTATHPRVVVFALAASVLGGVLFGWLPVRRLASAGPLRALAGDHGSSPGRGARGRRGLLALEVALTVVLLASAGLLVRSAERLLDQDPGFDPAGVLAVRIALPSDRYPADADRASFWAELQRRGESLPGVERAGLIHSLPFRGSVDGGFSLPDRSQDAGDGPHAVKQIVGPGTLEALDVRLLAGRTFAPSDSRDAPQVAVVSESLARRYWPPGEAVGQRIRFSWMTDQEQEIVGVVEDIRTSSLEEDGAATIYMSADQLGPPALHLIVRGRGEPLALIEGVQEVVTLLDPAQPVGDAVMLDDVVRSSVGDVSTLGRLLAVFAILALFLAVVGLYGVAGETVLARRREIGLRMAVGARRGAVAGRVVRTELPALLVGVALGLAGALVAGRLLEGLLFGTRPAEPAVLATVVGLLIVTGLAALTGPAVRAARMQPSEILREG